MLGMTGVRRLSPASPCSPSGRGRWGKETRMRPDEHVHDRRFLTRRAAMAVLAGGGVTLLTGGHTTTSAPAEGPPVGPACIVRPQQMEGPYFVDERRQRSDIRADPADGAVQPGWSAPGGGAPRQEGDA